jgi:hypothetical protein
VGVWIGLGLVAAALVGHHWELPGIYDDEVVQAHPALRFLDPERPRAQIDGAATLRVAGRDLPFLTQPYMGALKSLALIPVFACFEPSAAVLRATTLVWSWLGLGFLLLALARLYGPAVACWTALVLVLDPSFLWTSRHDWGSSALAFALRCAALACLVHGWPRRRRAWLAAGGFCIGLGLFNKIDFVVFPLAAAVALLAAAPALARSVLRERRGEALAVAAGLAAGAAPLLLALGQVQEATLRAFAAAHVSPVTLADKLGVARMTLDGSYWDALFRVGGRMRSLAEADAVRGPFPWLFGTAAIGLALHAALRRRRAGTSPALRADAFALWISLASIAVLFAIPRSGRIHHVLNLYPFPQLVAVIALVRLWEGGERSRRAAAAAGLVATVAGSAWVHAGIWSTLGASGGKGLWSAVRMRHAEELAEGSPRPTAVALDWGFAWALRYAQPGLEVIDLASEAKRRAGEVWSLEGDGDFDYLLYPDDYAVFLHGAHFLAAARRLPPRVASVRDHYDGQGDLAFRSVRIRHPHRLRVGRGIEIELVPGPGS